TPACDAACQSSAPHSPSANGDRSALGLQRARLLARLLLPRRNGRAGASPPLAPVARRRRGGLGLSLLRWCRRLSRCPVPPFGRDPFAKILSRLSLLLVLLPLLLLVVRLLGVHNKLL